MNNYRELLLRIQNCIIERRKMSAQKKLRLLLIGLGGTGKEYLEILKRYAYSEIHPENQKEVGTSYILAHRLSYCLKNENKEKVALRMQSASSYIWEKNICDTYYGIKHLINDKVASLIEKEQQLRHGKESTIPVESNVNIRIYAGITGGTGSGALLDICHLIHQAMKKENQWRLASCCVYFCLPNINLSVSQVSDSSVVNVNGYAVMKELDYYMNFESISGKCDEQHMRHFFEPTNKLTIKNYYRIFETKMGGFAQNKVYDYTMNVVGDCIMKFVVENASTMWKHLYSWSVNLKKRIMYCLSGELNVVMPINKIKVYLARDFFADISQRKRKISTDVGITQIMYNSGSAYHEFQNSIIEKIRCQMPLIELGGRKFTLISNKKEVGLKERIVLSEIIEKIQQNMVDLLIEVNIQMLIQECLRNRFRVENEKRVSKMFNFCTTCSCS